MPDSKKIQNKQKTIFLFYSKTFLLCFFFFFYFFDTSIRFSHPPPSILSASAPCCPPQNPVLSEFCHKVCWNRTNLGIKHERTQILSQSLNWIYLLKTLKPELLRLSANRWLKPEGSVISEGESFIERETLVNLPSSSCRATKI